MSPERIRRGRPAPPNPFVPIGRTPVAGFYRMRLVKGGPFVAVVIRLDADRHEPENPENKLDRSPVWYAEIDGQEVEIGEAWGPHMRLRPTDLAEYNFLIADAAYTRKYGPDEPEANPTKAVDISTMPVIF